MTFNEYQAEANKTALDLATRTFWYSALGLAGETGEIAEKIKKYYRDGASLDGLLKELGDVLWYLAAPATHANLTLDDVAQANIDKLASRQARGVIQGRGDNR